MTSKYIYNPPPPQKKIKKSHFHNIGDWHSCKDKWKFEKGS